MTHDMGFHTVIMLDFYDGPENGLIVFPSGAAMRFSPLAESRIVILRAYEFVPLNGNWMPDVLTIRAASRTSPPGSRFYFPEGADEFRENFEERMMAARGCGYFVGVGTTWLEKMLIAEVSPEEVVTLQNADANGRSFNLIHRFIKNKKLSINR
ncbi:hypothetical protein [Iodidimonas sp. SYSU 1G8]|uniref:hypothetical protein n=1 Tax=Iodidimonas sp. SYSU 1G8 TaxID=3133967 RepID=UPI0031FF34F0